MQIHILFAVSLICAGVLSTELERLVERSSFSGIIQAYAANALEQSHT